MTRIIRRLILTADALLRALAPSRPAAAHLAPARVVQLDDDCQPVPGALDRHIAEALALVDPAKVQAEWTEIVAESADDWERDHPLEPAAWAREMHLLMRREVDS